MTLRGLWWAFRLLEGDDAPFSSLLKAPLAFFDGRDVGTVSAVDVLQFRNAQFEAGVSDRKVRRQLDACVLLLRWALACGAFDRGGRAGYRMAILVCTSGGLWGHRRTLTRIPWGLLDAPSSPPKFWRRLAAERRTA